MTIFRKLRSKPPTILCCLATVGVIFTAITAAKAKKKADEKLEKARSEKSEELSKAEVVKVVATSYIPPIAIGIGTVVCIFGANILNKKKQASLTSAYALLQSSYRQYSNKVKEHYGIKAHNDIMNEIRPVVADKKTIYSYDWASSADMGFDDTDEIELLFCECVSGKHRYFKSTPSRVLLAEYHLNRNYILGMMVTINDFYDFLGLPRVGTCDDRGWDSNDGLYWIDFRHDKIASDNDTLEYYMITPIFGPEPFPVED